MPGILLSLGAGMAGGVLSSALPLGALGNLSSGFWNKLFTNQRLDPPTLIRLKLWGVLTDEEYLSKMEYEGFDSGRSTSLLVANANWMDPASVVRAGWREETGDTAIVDNLVDHGWIKEEAEGYLTAAKYYPQPADLVNWLAKEVYEKEMVEKYGLSAELAGVDRSPFYRAGMDDEQIESYWKAHWQHPAFTQLAEMLHRDQVTEKEMWSWFKLMEVPPFWRQKMINISYKPFTRVDVRRMNKIGVLEPEDLVRAYMDVGYDREKAEAMRDFTLLYNQQVGEDPDRDLTRSQLEKAYRLGMLSPRELTDYLEDMGYSEENAGFIHQIVDMDASLDRVYDRVAVLRNQVGAGLITVQEAGIKLSALGLSDDAVRHYEFLFASYVEEPRKIPSKADLKKWVAANVISDQQGFTYLKTLGYADQECYYYIQEWTGAEERYEEWIIRMREIAGRLD